MPPLKPKAVDDARVRVINIETLVHATKVTLGKHENHEHYLKRLTHLSLNGDAKRVVRAIENLHHCPNVRVLYLYDNEIRAIENLDVVPQLTHLYLQHNQIARMENLDGLVQLEKLFLDGNCIARLEGLQNCFYLQELHLSNQQLREDVLFSFDSQSLQALSVRSCAVLKCNDANPVSAEEHRSLTRSLTSTFGCAEHLQRSLRVLNLSNCHVRTAAPLGMLRSLEQLDLSKNSISELEDVFALLSALSMLTELDLSLNPVTSIPKYREKAMTFSSPRLGASVVCLLASEFATTRARAVVAYNSLFSSPTPIPQRFLTRKTLTRTSAA